MADEKLIRGLGRWDLAAVAINTIIGTGIFILPAKVFGLIGSWSLFAFIACAVIVGLIVLCFCEVSSRFDSTGGMYLYAKEAFGSEIGFEVGWLYWVVRVATFAANCNALLLYLSFFIDGADTGAARVLIISIIVIGTAVINIAGVRQTAVATNIFTVGKILPLLVFAAIGIFFIRPGNFSFGTTPASGDFSAAVLLLIYAFVGFEAAVIPAGEAKDPKTAMPFALFAALILCAVLFLIIQIVAVGTLPGLADSKTPLADAAAGFLGAAGGAFISIGALISVLGNLNGGFLATSRIPFAMAEHKELPAVFGRVHERSKTPHIAIIATAAVILFMTIFTTFLSAVTIATITRLLVYATTCLALPVLRQRSDVPAAAFRAPLGILAAVLALGLTAWLLGNVDFKKEGLPIVVAVALGMVIYYANKIFSRRAETASN